MIVGLPFQIPPACIASGENASAAEIAPQPAAADVPLSTSATVHLGESRWQNTVAADPDPGRDRQAVVIASAPNTFGAVAAATNFEFDPAETHLVGSRESRLSERPPAAFAGSAQAEAFIPFKVTVSRTHSDFIDKNSSTFRVTALSAINPNSSA